jgi:hypothetical protein
MKNVITLLSPVLATVALLAGTPWISHAQAIPVAISGTSNPTDCNDVPFYFAWGGTGHKCTPTDLSICDNPILDQEEMELCLQNGGTIESCTPNGYTCN